MSMESSRSAGEEKGVEDDNWANHAGGDVSLDFLDQLEEMEERQHGVGLVTEDEDENGHEYGSEGEGFDIDDVLSRVPRDMLDPETAKYLAEYEEIMKELHSESGDSDDDDLMFEDVSGDDDDDDNTFKKRIGGLWSINEEQEGQDMLEWDNEEKEG